VKFKAPFIKSVRIRGYIVFYLNPIEILQSLSIYFGYQNFAKITQIADL